MLLLVLHSLNLIYQYYEKKCALLLLLVFSTFSFANNLNEYAVRDEIEVKVDYSIRSMLLKTNIGIDGNVNYANFNRDREVFKKFLRILSGTKIDNDWTNNEKIAFWINIYNAYTIKLIIDNLPLKSIKEIKRPWDKKFFKINRELLSLGDVEHEILRKRFKEPRIHFSINCASKSCPRIVQIPYKGKNLDKLLERQTREYINNSKHNKISNKSYQLSKLFSWFPKDFKQAEGSIERFVSKYSKRPIENQENEGFIVYD